LRTITTAALGGLAISLLIAPPAWADTFQVNTIADRVDANIGDGVCADARGHCPGVALHARIVASRVLS